MSNRFACYGVHSKLSHSTHNGNNTAESKKLYMDTDPESQTEIIIDIIVKKPSRAGNLMLEVKIDPGSEANCILLHKFQILFPYLARDGVPKEGVLEPTSAKFTGYRWYSMTSYGYMEVQVQHITTIKFHPVRFYVLDMDAPHILVYQAAAFWIGLVKVLCSNKTPKVTR